MGCARAQAVSGICHYRRSNVACCHVLRTCVQSARNGLNYRGSCCSVAHVKEKHCHSCPDNQNLSKYRSSSVFHVLHMSELRRSVGYWTDQVLARRQRQPLCQPHHRCSQQRLRQEADSANDAQDPWRCQGALQLPHHDGQCGQRPVARISVKV